MNITSFSRSEIEKGLSVARSRNTETDNTVRILFSPVNINSSNFEQVCNIYSHIGKDDFDTVVVIESRPGTFDKKLQMPSNKQFSTPLGDVTVNDRLRNEFCDEDDDFFIEDGSYSSDLSLYSQLMMLQCVLDDFSVLSLQITDESEFIIKELAGALEEILASHNALIVFCCNLEENRESADRIFGLADEKNSSGLINFLNSEGNQFEGIGSLYTGLMVSDDWGLKVHLEEDHSTGSAETIAAFAEMQRQPIFG